ncbi:unnamed protein product [Dicrocoelium dendriticum]|nr:unnamed protein product [Dicrocoelium dendriticum]
MFATLLAFGLTHSFVYCEELFADVRLFSSRIDEYARTKCDLLITRSPALWNNGAFRNCLAGLPIEIEEGGFITQYMVTVNTTKIKNFAKNANRVDKFAIINRRLNSDGHGCVTVTGPNWDKVLDGFVTRYPVEIHLNTTALDQDLNCTTIISNIRKVSPLLKPIDCQHEATHFETAQMFHHRFEVKMQMPDINDRPVTETAILHLLGIQRMLEIGRSNCTPISVPIYDSKAKIWNFAIVLNENQADTINCSTIRDRSPCLPKSCELVIFPGYTGPQLLHVKFEARHCGQQLGPAENREAAFLFNWFWNRVNTWCPIIWYGKTKDAFEQAALVSGPSNVDVCQEAKNHTQYGAHSCEEIQKENRISANKGQRTFRMRLEEPIYLANIPWHMNEHSKFVHYLNSRGSNCKFNGYGHLNKSESIREVPGHTSSSRFL